MKLIIFDIDETLLYSNKIDSECFATTYKDIYNQAFPSIDWTKYPHVTDHTIFNVVIQDQFARKATALEIAYFQDQFVTLLKEKRNVSPSSFLSIKGAKEIIAKLVELQNVAVGIATGGWQKPALTKLKHIGIDTQKLFMSFADNKITRESILQESIDKARVKHPKIDRVIYIGDAVWDVRTTRNMNMDFIGIRRKGDADHLYSKGATQVLEDYSNFDLFMEAIEKASPPINLI